MGNRDLIGACRELLQLRKHPANVQAVRINFNPEERSVACIVEFISVFNCLVFAGNTNISSDQ